MTALRPIRRAIDWGELAPLRLRAREVAEGVFAGLHRSAKRGAGVEFGGFRQYVPGDDLRWLDRRSLLRHERLVVRQFETETDRTVSLLVDASASMAFRSAKAKGAKLAFAAVVAAALTRVALASGDPVGLGFIGGGEHREPVPRAAGREQFERIVGALDAIHPGGDAHTDPAIFARALQWVSRATRRGAIVVVLSDLVDLPAGAADRLAEVAANGRVCCVVQTLDPVETEFPFQGTVRLRALEGTAVVETDADATRDRYLAALSALTASWEKAIVARRGRLLRVTTADDPVRVVRKIVESTHARSC